MGVEKTKDLYKYCLLLSVSILHHFLDKAKSDENIVTQGPKKY